ncbi:MAG: hypothetical protein KDK12_02920, partial [Rhodobacteraceae bacterium]|nr:hypothetical protein [Paracoccaceae bacterium]
MTRDINERRAAKARTSVAAGQLALVGTGLGALALIAVSAQTLLSSSSTPAGDVAIASLAVPRGIDARARHLPAEGAAAPRIWLSSLASPGDAPFAAPDYATDPVLPRRQALAAPRPAETVSAPTPAPDAAVQRDTVAAVPAPVAPTPTPTLRAEAPRSAATP